MDGTTLAWACQVGIDLLFVVAIVGAAWWEDKDDEDPPV